MDESRTWTIPGAWQLAWLLAFVAALALTAFTGTFVGVALQGGKWRMLAAVGAAFLASAFFLYWLVTRVRRVLVGPRSVVFEAAAVEREVDFEEIGRVGLIARGTGWRVLLLCKAGGGYRFRARTREWADLIAARAKVPLEETPAEPPASRPVP